MLNLIFRGPYFTLLCSGFDCLIRRCLKVYIYPDSILKRLRLSYLSFEGFLMVAEPVTFTASSNVIIELIVQTRFVKITKSTEGI